MHIPRSKFSIQGLLFGKLCLPHMQKCLHTLLNEFQIRGVTGLSIGLQCLNAFLVVLSEVPSESSSSVLADCLHSLQTQLSFSSFVLSPSFSSFFILLSELFCRTQTSWCYSSAKSIRVMPHSLQTSGAERSHTRSSVNWSVSASLSSQQSVLCPNSSGFHKSIKLSFASIPLHM